MNSTSNEGGGAEAQWSPQKLHQSLSDVTEAGRQFRGAWRSFCKSGGSEVIFAGIMAPLHPLPRLTGLTCKCLKESFTFNLPNLNTSTTFRQELYNMFDDF